MNSASLIGLAVRCGLVLLFMPFSAADKIFGFRHALAQTRQVFERRGIAVFVLLAGLGIEVICGLGIVTGVSDRAAALVMAAYCAATALLYKRFWAQGDFWASPTGKGRALFWDFLKNLSLGAGFLLITVGTDGMQWQRFVDQPFASSHPYESRPAHARVIVQARSAPNRTS